MSSTFMFSPPCALAMPSVIMFRQNGQAVATLRAPVASASCARKTRDALVGHLVEPHPTAACTAAEGFFFHSAAFRDTARRWQRR
jgi:hypothetical protein